MSGEKDFETYLKEKYANEEKEQNTATDSPNFQVGFLEFLQKDEHEEDNSSRELDNFIAAERSSIPALDKLLGKFFKDVRKQNGSEYEPDSISSFQKSIQRHLKE